MCSLLFLCGTAQAQLATGTVDFDVDSLRDQTQVTISLSDNSTLILLRDYVVDHEPGSYTWVGSVQGDVNGKAFISVNKPHAVGNIQTTTQLFELTITGNLADPVQEIDPATLPPEAEPLRDPIFSHGFEDAAQESLIEAPAAVCDDTPASIDVMVLYSDDAANASPNINAEIRQLIAMANDSFLYSRITPGEPDGIELKLNLVHSQLVQVDESLGNGMREQLLDFATDGEGFVDEVHALRNQFQADLNFLVLQSSDMCGIAPLVEGEERAFAIINRRCTPVQVFTHELGHLFGADHDKYVADPPFTGSNYGYVHIGVLSGWMTVMAYPNQCKDAGLTLSCPITGFFSSPDYLHDGVPRGIAGTDNRKQLINAAPARACYRDNPAPPSQPVGLNDTGIDWGGNYPSGNNTTCTGETIAAQDCSHGRDATQDNDADGHAGFSFTKLDNNGNALPAAASSWSCVRDEVTGLTWEGKTDDGAMRDTDNTYTWYNPDPNTNGGNAGSQNGGACVGSNCDTYSYVQAVNSLPQALCGARDWRMPSMPELLSIVDYSRVFPTIDTVFFPYQRGDSVWSGSTYAPHPFLYARAVDFGRGVVGGVLRRDEGRRVRLVRSDP